MIASLLGCGSVEAFVAIVPYGIEVADRPRAAVTGSGGEAVAVKTGQRVEMVG
jgi:hypothetical protein